MSKGTPGPWRVHHGRLEGNISLVADLDNDVYVVVEGWHLGAVDEDARLIAAAPDLLAALQRLHDDTADYVRINNLGDPYQNQNMRDARDALTKARGQS